MVKVQQFFNANRTKVITATTLMLVVAETCHFLGHLMIPYLVLMAIIGITGLLPILLTAISSLQVKVISIDVLVTIAVLGAFIIGEFNEAAIVTWLFMLGEFLEDRSLAKTRSAVKELTQMAPQTANVIAANGKVHEEDVDFLNPGTTVLVKTGAQVPVDGIILTGHALLNEASVTGESKLIKKTPGDTVYAGTMMENGTITVKTTAAGEETTFGKIIELVEEAENSQTKTQRFIDRFAQYYTPAVLVVAIIVGLLTQNFRLAITVMVLGCPGALVIGVPASTVAGIGNGAKHGILFKGSDVMDQLAHIDTMIFDKTGTLTVGQPEVVELLVLKGNRQAIINQAVASEAQSDHPLAKSISKLTATATPRIDQLEAIKGQGLEVTINEQLVFIGSPALIKEQQLTTPELDRAVTKLTNAGNSIVIFASANQQNLAVFAITDRLRPTAHQALTKLKQQGVQRLIMLTGDNQATAQQIAAQLPLDAIHANMLPQEKAQFIKEEQTHGHRVAFVGDGINDSPALSQADVAIAMDSGTDVAMDVADLVLVKANLTSLVTGRQLAQQTLKNMNENILIALVTVFLLFVGLFAGYIEMASGMLVHELSILLVILNALRLTKFLAKSWSSSIFVRS